MTSPNQYQQPIDPRLAHRLQQLRAAPPRSPEAAARGIAQFTAEVDEILKEQGFLPSAHSTSGSIFQRWKEKWNMATPRTRTVLTFIAAFTLVAVFLFGGAGMTAYASQSSLPGDTLYSVKTGVEQTQVSLARDTAEKARLNLVFAERRLDEISRLINNRRYADITWALEEYEHSVQSAINALQAVAAGDPASAQELASQVAYLLKRYAQTLSSMADTLPDTARNEVEHAISVSNTARKLYGEFEFVGIVEEMHADSWVISGRTLTISPKSEIKGGIKVGDLVEVEFVHGADGGLILREVEITDDEDDENHSSVNSNHGSRGEFTAIVEQIGADFWVIGGRTLTISPRSEIEGVIKVGDLVEVEFFRDADGNLTLREVEFADDKDDDMHDDDDKDRHDDDDKDDHVSDNDYDDDDDDDDDDGDDDHDDDD